MRPRTRVLLERAIEEGLGYGWRRAHKHMESPDEAYVLECALNAVMSSIDDVFVFDPEEAD